MKERGKREGKSALPWSGEELLARAISFQGRPLPTLAEPFTLEGEEAKRVRRCARALWLSAERVTRAFVEEKEIRRLFGYGPLQTRCILKDPGYRPAIPLGRLDAFLVEGRPRFLEFNTDGTAGWHYTHALSALWRERRGLPPDPNPLPDLLLDTLTGCFRRWDRRGVERPRMAIVDWEEVGTRAAQEALAARFTARGVPCALADPRTLRLEGGRLVGPDGPVDIVYRRLVSEEAFAKAEEIRPFLDAYLEGAACFVGGFRTDPAWSKILFTVLSDPRYGRLFPGDLGKTLTACVPWTRAVRPGPTTYGGGEAEMEELLLGKRENFLLKPAQGYDGRGVVAGPYVERKRWEEAVRRALSSGHMVAQTFQRPGFVEIPPAGRVAEQLGVFLLEGEVAGFLPRCSPREVLEKSAPEYYRPAAPATRPIGSSSATR